MSFFPPRGLEFESFIARSAYISSRKQLLISRLSHKDNSLHLHKDNFQPFHAPNYSAGSPTVFLIGDKNIVAIVKRKINFVSRILAREYIFES